MNKQIIIDYKEYIELEEKVLELRKLCNDLYLLLDDNEKEKFKERMKGHFYYL